jgi:hypothetical protein
LILEHILPARRLKLECVRVHMRRFRIGHAFQCSKLRAARTVYITDLFPDKASTLVLPLAPIGGSKEVALSILYDPGAGWVAHTDFKSQHYNPAVNYAIQFKPAPPPRLPGWYGSEAGGSRVYAYEHDAGRLGENLLGHLGMLAAKHPGRGRVGLGKVQRWPSGWFAADATVITRHRSYEGRPWSEAAHVVADDLFAVKFAKARGVPVRSLPPAQQHEHYARAAERFFTVPRLLLEGSCRCGCGLLS